MPRTKRVPPRSAPVPARGTWPRRWWLAAALGGALAAGAVWLGPGGGWTTVCLARARACVGDERLAAAARWLDRAEWLAAGDSRVALVRAAIARRQGHADVWAREIDAARDRGAPTNAIDRERALAALWSGTDPARTERLLTELAAAGAAPAEIVAGMVTGCLTRGDWRQADHLLGTAAADVDDPVLTEFLTARVRAAAGDTAAAAALLGRVLARRPDHDGAREALVELLSESGRVDEALTEAQGWAARVHDDPLALVTLSRLLRRAGRATETSAIAARLERVPQPAGFVVRELAEIDLETGRPAEALPRLDQLTALPAAAQPRLDETRAVARALAGVPDASLITPYARHCAPCHGDGREPRGPAAPDLFPAARDFRTDAFRLVTSPDGQPSAADVAAVIRRGIPGTSMPGFPELDADVVAEIVAAVLGQRQPRAMPATAPVWLPGAEQLAAGDADRGRAVYARSGCATCHGPAGSPVAAPALFDERGLPTLPRDLVHEPFKGGRAPADVAARLALGMPGSPHPAVSLAPSDLADLVAHVRALEGPPHPPTTNHQRLRRATGPTPTAGR